jgi:hypothetical protein
VHRKNPFVYCPIYYGKSSNLSSIHELGVQYILFWCMNYKTMQHNPSVISFHVLANILLRSCKCRDEVGSGRRVLHILRQVLWAVLQLGPLQWRVHEGGQGVLWRQVPWLLPELLLHHAVRAGDIGSCSLLGQKWWSYGSQVNDRSQPYAISIPTAYSKSTSRNISSKKENYNLNNIQLRFFVGQLHINLFVQFNETACSPTSQFLLEMCEKNSMIPAP